MFKKNRVSYLYRTAQPPTLAAFRPWGIQRELVVQDLPDSLQKYETLNCRQNSFHFFQINLTYFLLLLDINKTKGMESPQKSVGSQALNYGIVTGLVMVVYALLLYVFDATTNQYLGYGSYVILLIGIIIATKFFRDKENNGYLNYSKGIGLGTLMALYSSIISGIFTFVLYKYIDPQAIEPMLQQAKEEMYRRGIEGDQLEQSIAVTRQFLKPHWMAISGIFYTTIVGLILSLVVSVFLKRTEQER